MPLYKEDGSVIKSVKTMKPGDRITIRWLEADSGRCLKALDAFPDKMGASITSYEMAGMTDKTYEQEKELLMKRRRMSWKSHCHP